MSSVFTRKISEILPGPGWFLGVRVLVQNRTKEPVCVIGSEITATIPPEKTQAFFDGLWDEDEYEIDVERHVDSKTMSGYAFMCRSNL